LRATADRETFRRLRKGSAGDAFSSDRTIGEYAEGIRGRRLVRWGEGAGKRFVWTSAILLVLFGAAR
jgi:hypothetical protein